MGLLEVVQLGSLLTSLAPTGFASYGAWRQGLVFPFCLASVLCALDLVLMVLSGLLLRKTVGESESSS